MKCQPLSIRFTSVTSSRGWSGVQTIIHELKLSWTLSFFVANTRSIRIGPEGAKLCTADRVHARGGEFSSNATSGVTTV